MERILKQSNGHLPLPEDIMIDILKRLPFESIMALKCVSKQWKDVIDNPKFFKTVTFSINDDLYSLSLRNNANDEWRFHPPFTVRRIPMIPKQDHASRISVSELSNRKVCNGMACVYPVNGQFLFYNLLTGSSHSLTDAPLLKYASEKYMPWFCYGFGYDVFDDDYKMMVVCQYAPEHFIRNKDRGLFWVYSFKRSVWKQLSGFPYDAYDWSRDNYLPVACSFKGVLHWCFTKREHPNYKQVIVTYDMHTCMFGEIPAPIGYSSFGANVMELGGQLCFSTEYPKIDVWVMREYGVGLSWTKLLSIDKSWISCNTALVTLYECQDGRKLVLFVCQHFGTLYWYDVDSGEVRVIQRSTWRSTRVVGARQGNKRKRN